jgi:hypothetical protein
MTILHGKWHILPDGQIIIYYGELNAFNYDLNYLAANERICCRAAAWRVVRAERGNSAAAIANCPSTSASDELSHSPSFC